MRVLLGLAILPVFVILWFVYSNDKHKESGKNLAITIILGVLSTIPVAILETIVDPLFSVDVEDGLSIVTLFINVFLGIAIIEELAKWLIVVGANYNKKHFDETYDAIVYCTFASLGFALLENILYALVSLITNGSTAGFVTVILRAVTSIPGHACFGVFMGYFISKAKISQVYEKKKNEKKNLILALLIPTLVHTLFDAFLLSQNVSLILVWLAMIIVCDVLSILFIKDGAKRNITLVNFNESQLNNPQQYNPQQYNQQQYNPQQYNPQQYNPQQYNQQQYNQQQYNPQQYNQQQYNPQQYNQQQYNQQHNNQNQ